MNRPTGATNGKAKKSTDVAVDPSHRMQPPRGTALAIAELNETEWEQAQRAAILGMDALDQMEASGTATVTEREAFRLQRRSAFAALRDIGLMAGPMHRLNKSHIELKTSTTPVNGRIADVKAAQRERGERRRGGK